MDAPADPAAGRDGLHFFSIILAIFLVGLGLGSRSDHTPRERWFDRASIGHVQISSGGRYRVERLDDRQVSSLSPINPALTQRPWIILQVDFVRCLWAILPAAALWGALSVGGRSANQGQVPAMSARLCRQYRGRDRRRAGVQHAADPWLGTQASQRILILSWLFQRCCAGVLVSRRIGRLWFRYCRAVWLVLIIGITLGWLRASLGLPDCSWPAGFMTVRLQDKVDIIYVGEGMNSSMAVSRCRTAF